MNTNDLAAGQRLAEMALKLARQATDIPEVGGRLVVDSLNVLGTISFFIGDTPKVQEHLERALGLARKLDYPAGEAAAAHWLGWLHSTRTGQMEQAQRLFQTALRLYRGLGDRSLEADSLRGLGETSTVFMLPLIYLHSWAG